MKLPGKSPQRLSLFDLDNTLIAGDSDYGWARFLMDIGVLDAEAYERRNAAFLADYQAGTLDINAFLAFQLRPLAEHEPARLLAWRDRFVADVIRPMLLPAARNVVDARLAEGDLVAVVTATNSFITRPIAELYGIRHLIATEPEVVDARYTGGVAGVPCFQTGKLTCLHEWLSGQGLELGGFTESWFYSDSHNDLPLLSAVSNPVAVDPDPKLLREAQSRGWPVLSWR